MTSTSDARLLTLDEDWPSVKTKFELIEAGRYDVTLDEIKNQNNERVDVQFSILDEGRFAGRKLFQTYILTTEPGKRLFKELLEAIHVEPRVLELDLNLCIRRILRVRVKHNVREDKTYANVVEHIAVQKTNLID